ncbi:hypothetical protein [Frigoriglobus tundricola]|uniref:Uncharacterized protein n=1 Tax=Frigoriglobus tundricola TaxID=2774151 RepID=A0A6M5YN96_9BACT|nr:hypothetical protein [Frigoriglobus tundricola]QJW94711.1 hypothetical protein FTUN_2233 [Frigoriglobus tundricola]
MKLWAFSVYATRQTFKNGAVQFDGMHTCAMLEAVDRAHAEGKALQVARKLFPTDDGWGAHHVAVSAADNVVTLDGVTLTKGN